MPLNIPEWSGQCPKQRVIQTKMPVAVDTPSKSRVETNPFHDDLKRLLCALGELGLQ